MPLVFVHGVATRQTPEEKTWVAQRTALFQKLVFNSDDTHVFNPDWGTQAAVFSPSLPWLPVPRDIQAFGVQGGPHPMGDVGLSGIAGRDAAQAVDLLASVSLDEAASKADDPNRLHDAIVLAKACSDYLEIMNIVDDHRVKGLPRLDAGGDLEFAEALTSDLEQSASMEAYGGGLAQTIKDAVSAAGGWIGNLTSDAVLRAKRADLSRSVAYFLGDIFVYLRHRDAKGPEGDEERLFAPILDDLIRAWKAPREAREPLLVVGHSLGGVLLYDMLSDPNCIAKLKNEAGEDFKIDLLLTVGSQPGFFKDLRMYENNAQSPESRLPRPILTKDWLNVFDFTDVFSFTCEPFFEGVQDFGYDTSVDVFQAHSAYFKRPSFYKRTQLRLRGLGYL